MPKSLILCDCLGTQSLDQEAISGQTNLACKGVYTELCGAQSAQAAEAIKNGNAVIACMQERAFFQELANEIEAGEPEFLDIRDRAGWSKDTRSKLPKISALIAEGMLPIATAKSLDVISEGLCLIVAPYDAKASEVAHSAARDLCEILNVTVLQHPDAEIPTDRRYDTVAGKLRSARGHFGDFNVRIENFREPARGGRGAPEMLPSSGDAQSVCDVMLDLSGEASLFAAPEKRDGYLRADIKHAQSVAQAVLEASQLIGTFEKPLYLKFEESLCAHSRAEQPACSKCLNACPTGAITSAGDTVAIDPMICAGCGACSSLCPSGAITYDAPPTESVFRRITTLTSAFMDAGGKEPRLLVHDADFGTEMIQLASRYGDGLPANVIPLEMSALASFGHAEMLAALASGFAGVAILVAPKSDQETISFEYELARAIAPSSDNLRLLDVADPDALCKALYGQAILASSQEPILAMGNRRQITRLAAKSMNEGTHLPLPPNAPYGAVLVDTSACTLCLSCVSLCPSGALADNPDMPQLRFQEDACLQCGLCSNICPESAITLEPRLNLADSALNQVVLHEEEPCACIECGALFGVKSTVDRIMEKLAGKHSMFATSDTARLIQMCDDCRVKAQYHSQNAPMAGKARPAPRTSEDYFSKRKDH
ncbi:4Fe-4S binding protein [Falsihalocynthiibacter sp. SS001]|uniref:4Fe-4S binding protein n=1 Tax=Falsihalocynthiibacter sp. SS001 TaxID=3349698 RepID=UPI0036D3DCC4